MRHGARLALAATLLVAGGCAQAPIKDGIKDDLAGVTAEGMARMAATDSFVAKRKIVLENCTAAGFEVATRGFARCVTSYYAVDAARLRDKAKTQADRAARRHSLCVDPVRFELARCIEI
jgi:hypothetical protein